MKIKESIQSREVNIRKTKQEEGNFKNKKIVAKIE